MSNRHCEVLFQMYSIIKKYNSFSLQVRASFWFLICTIIQRSISIITTPIYTRLLSTGEYGRYGVFTSWMGILTCFVTMYIYSGVYPQAFVKFEDKRNQYSSAMQCLTLTLVIVWGCLYYPFRSWWNELIGLNTSQMVAMFVVMWANAVFGFWSVEQQFKYKYRVLLFVTLIEAFFQPVLCVSLILIMHDKITGLVWGMALAMLICYSPLFIQQVRRGKVFFSKKIWSYSLGFAIPLIPHYISSVVLNSSDRIMIQHIIGEDQAGIYTLAYSISICGTLINQAVLQSLQPWILQSIKEKRYQEIRKVAYPSLIGIALINLVIILFTPELIRVFAPSSYSSAIWVMPPIIMSVFFMFSYNLFSLFEFYYEKKVYVSAATMTGAVLNVILNYIFIKKYGYYAAGYTTLFCYMVFAITHYYFQVKICKEEIPNVTIYDPRILFCISVSFLCMGFLLMLTYYHEIIRYSLAVLVAIVIVILRKKIIGFVKTIISKKNLEQK